MIKAIPTTYAGNIFRSRLEARYAKLFDLHKIKWGYEVEGYEYGNIRYLPDFYFPEMNSLFEVKGPNIPGIEKPTNLRKLIESGIVADVDWWNPKVLIIVGDSLGNITLAGSDEKAALVKCCECQKYFFLAIPRSYECRICGTYDGDHHLDDWISPLSLPQIEIESPIEIDTILAPKCPQCESDMVLRMAKTGLSKGKNFWGCSKFPDCKGTRPFKTP